MSQAQRDSQGGPAPMDVAEERMIIPNCTLAVEEFPEQYIESQCLARLLHIAEHCPQARLKALKVAEKVSRQCMDVGMQRQIVKLLRAACVDHNEPYPSGMPSEALIDAKSLRVKEKARMCFIAATPERTIVHRHEALYETIDCVRECPKHQRTLSM
ncbi:hypothetical protein PTSG_12250 [Salpingoeca rosetta]|uniref:Uncharacterized protein n=1 Tax=Salpingoeca rosetta (strain ATCC 50818 / BSB-021) TaxID=946362 RepID=F2U9F1_SALR5|nr:uncharacterized protein PTSG_12250 [Salpingoeca rosetta]EGD73354.1 hypothetical protein PTSG_12250 [Salpingoeca rosetta]|eukprot:XP_004994384.1 hypothetical protein PTSG_12250 [Salpingoeca rosetta]